MNTTKQQLKKYLQDNGKNSSWVKLYNKFPFKGEHLTNKQKSDAVRGIWRNITGKRKSSNKRLHNAKILVFDIETAPLKAYVWRLWKQNIYPTGGQLQSNWFMLTWSAKWLFEDKVMSGKLTTKEVLLEDDSRLVKQLHSLLNEADIVISHNGIQFDHKVLNTRFLLNGLPPTSPYQVIDTKVHAKKHLSFESNKLDYIGQILGLGNKIKTEFSLWEQCMVGNTKALSEMERYNIQDVNLLEAVYLKLRPFIKPHPNLGLFIDDDNFRCPSCGSKHLTWNSTYKTYASSYDAFSCDNCGSIGRSRQNNLTKAHKKTLTLSTPK